MSNEALTAVAKMNIRPSGRKFVAMALADYADEQWSCFPSVAQLAEYTSQGEKTVRDHLDGLVEIGFLTRTRHRKEDGTLGRYRYFIQRQFSPVADFARGEKHPKPAANFAAHNPHIEPPIDTPDAREDLPDTAEANLATVLDKQRVKAVIDHRRKMRKPLTPYAAKMLARRFDAYGNAAEAADAMIANGWQGFEPDWMERRKSQAPPARTQPTGKRTWTDAMRAIEDERKQIEGDNGNAERLPAIGWGR